MAPIAPLSPLLRSAGIQGVDGATGVTGAEDTGGVDFASTLASAISGAGDQERAATEAADKFASGDPNVGIHEVMIEAEKASVSLRFATTVKNQALAAYRELMNTPV
jgi:flagellar hook-basal body complex protein FliE